MLLVFEEVAKHQPVGVSELARLMEDDKSAVQRALMTLADAGWISQAPGAPSRWHPSNRIIALAQYARHGDDLRNRARLALEQLRDESGESVLLILLEGDMFLVAEEWESRQMLRTASMVGMEISAHNTATSRAVLPYLDAGRQIAVLGELPAAQEMEALDRSRARGFSVSDGDVINGATSIGAPVFDEHGEPVAAVVMSGPSERLCIDRHVELGSMVQRAARGISLAAPAR